MEKSKLELLKEKFWTTWNNVFDVTDEEGLSEAGREKFIVFLVAVVLALCLWLMVNLSRDYNLNINMPIELGSIPEDQALAEDLPDFATVSVTGEGWKLINIYNNPPRIYVDVSNNEISLYDQVRQQLNAIPEIKVQKVQPLFLMVELEKKVSKKVPVIPNIIVSFKNQYDFVGEPRLVPDSVTVSGAASLINNVSFWQTDSVRINDVRNDIAESVNLRKSNGLIDVSRQAVAYEAEVAQYTEGEAKVPIHTRDMPNGKDVSFSPSSITVKYEVPIEEYARVQKLDNPISAYVSYRQLQNDSTGFVTPQIQQSPNDLHMRIRSFQPRDVAYFMVLGD